MNKYIFHIARVATRASPTVIWSRDASEKAWAVVKIGRNILVDGVPHEVSKAVQGGRGRGASFVKAKLRNLVTGKGIDRTFNSEDPVEVPDLDRFDVEFSWDEETDYVFIDVASFEEFRVPKEFVKKANFLVPGMKLVVYKYKDALIEVGLPHTYEFEVQTIDTTERM